jgi:hypothetical protein
MGKKIKITESDLVTMIQKLVKEDAGMDTPGGNPDYFYGDGSLDKVRKFADNQEEEESEMSKEDIIQELVAIYSYSQDGATEEVNQALENLLYRLEGFESSVNESRKPIKEQDTDHMTEWMFNSNKRIEKLVETNTEELLSGQKKIIKILGKLYDDNLNRQ